MAESIQDIYNFITDSSSDMTLRPAEWVCILNE